MRYFILAAAIAGLIGTLGTAPAAALNPPTKPAAKAEPLRELPADWLEDADLGSDRAGEHTAGAEGDDRLSGGERGARSADLARECKESSGTTGAILGAVAGGLLGNVVDGGDHRVFGTLVGAGGGALLGRSIEQKRAAAGCR